MLYPIEKFALVTNIQADRKKKKNQMIENSCSFTYKKGTQLN
jgi:hypothetical protein